VSIDIFSQTPSEINGQTAIRRIQGVMATAKWNGVASTEEA
jgi:hypothetical protein